MSSSAGVARGPTFATRPKVIPVLLFISPIVTTAIPRITWLFFPLIALVFILSVAGRTGDWQTLTKPNPTLIACLLISGYGLLSASWAADGGAAVEKAVLLAATVLVTFAASRAIPQLDDHQLQNAAGAFTLGTLVAALFLSFEILTGGGITRLILNAFHSHPRHARMHSGEITSLQPSVFNQNVAILACNLWPSLFFLRTRYADARRIIYISIFLAAVGIPVFLSEHQSSQIALIISTVVFGFAWFWSKQVIRLLAVLWCLAFVLVLPADFLAYREELHMANWLPGTFRARIIIWEYTAERVLEHPWLGIGANSTHAVREPRGTAEQPPGFVVPRTTAWHSHSLFLQTWFELGAIGAILMAIAGAMVALRMSLLPTAAQPFAAATFSFFMTIASSAWGMWQTWLICGFALLLLYVLTLSKALQQQGTHQTYDAATRNLPGDKTGQKPKVGYVGE